MLLLAVDAVVLVPPLATTAVVGDTGFTQVGLGYPGAFTALAATALQSVALLASWLTVGGLCVAMFLLPTRRTRPQAVHDGPELTVARRAAIVWALAAAAMVPFSAADAGGKELSALGERSSVSFLLTSTDFPVAWMIATGTAGLAALLLRHAFLWRHLIGPLALALPAILAPVVVGDILVGPAHDHGGDAGAVQAVVEAVFFGAATVLALRAAGGTPPSVPAVRRFALVSLAALPLLATAALVLLQFRMAGLAPLSNPTGRWSLLAVGALAAATAAVAVLARRPGARPGVPLAVIALAGAVTAACHGAMGRIPPPQYFVPTELVEVFLGYTLPDAPDLGTLLTAWRPNLLFTLIAFAAITCYGAAWIRVARSGERWPVGRGVAWMLGWTTVIVATSSGVGKYAGADFALHMLMHMGLNMLAPMLMALGGAVTLVLKAARPAGRGEPVGIYEWTGELMRWRPGALAYHPVLVFALFVGSYYGLYLTELFGLAIRFHWAHQLMNVHFLVTGYLFYSLAVGVDRGPRQLPHIGRLGFVFASMPFHAFFGVILMSMSTVIAETFYNYLDQPWATDLAASQRAGGGIAWAGAEIPLLILIIALSLQWARSDEREALRKDRHYDTGLDDEFEAYNRMLQALSERPGAPGPQETRSP
ncbi:cytochrome c oxidase assembly protein [Glycomyces sp. NPDC021274]|uniref:cytochrome c oxidase assembly protein n=1 Tax=Glycomyces sp. NPDC021274 TaxID=3155120 RepID=UPI003404F1C4